MRKIIYLVIILVLLVAACLYLRKYHQAAMDISFAPKQKQEKSLITDYLSGTVAQRSGDIEGAIKYFEKAQEKDPDNQEIVKRLYGLYLFEGRYENAVEQANRQYEVDKINNTDAEDRDPIAYLIIALDNFKHKKTKDNVTLLEPFVQQKYKPQSHVDGAVIPMILAWSYVVDEDYQNAFRVIDNIPSEYMLSIFSYNRALINDLANNKEVKIEGKNYNLYDKSQKFLSEVFAEIGQFSLQNANLEEAVIYLRLARYLDSDSYKLKKLLALAYEVMGRDSDAIKIYMEVPESSDNYAEALSNLALAYHHSGDDAKSLALLGKLKDMKNHEYEGLFAMGTLKMSDNDFQEAVKYFEEAKKHITKESIDNWNLFFNLGVAYDKLNDWPHAEENLKKAVEVYPQNPESLNYLAYSWLMHNKNIKQAREMLEAAVVRSGGAPHILDSYGWALYKLGSYNEAIPFLEQAVTGMSYSAVINDHLGDAYWQAGRKREARFQWQKALDVYDADQELSPEVTKQEIQKKIDSGM